MNSRGLYISQFWQKDRRGYFAAIVITTLLLTSVGSMLFIGSANYPPSSVSIPRIATNTLPIATSPADFSYYTYVEAKIISWVVTDPDIGAGACVEVRRNGTSFFTSDFTVTGQQVNVTCEKDLPGVHVYSLHVDDGMTGLILLDTVQVTTLEPELDTDFDGLSDFEEIRIYGSTPNDATSPAWNIGHFNYHAASEWHTEGDTDFHYEIINPPSTLAGSDHSPLFQMYADNIGDFQNLQIWHDINLGGSSAFSYVSFQLGMSTPSEFDQVCAMYLGPDEMDTFLQQPDTDEAIWMHLDMDAAGTGTLSIGGTYVCQIVSNRLYLFEIALAFQGGSYTVYMDHSWVGSFAFPSEGLVDVKIIGFDGDHGKDTNGAHVYVDNIRVGNCLSETQSLITGTTIPVITTKLYAPQMGLPGSYQKVTVTQDITTTTEVSLDIAGTCYGATGSGGGSVSTSLGCKNGFTWIATPETGDKWCGIRVKADILKAGLRFSGAPQSHLIATYAINRDLSYNSHFQLNITDFFTAFHDYYQEFQSAEEILPLLPDPRVHATFGASGNAKTENYKFSSPGQLMTLTWTVTSIQTWNIGGGINYQSDNYAFSLILKFQSTSQTTITYDLEVYIATDTMLDVDCNTFNNYKNFGFWFVDRTGGHTDTTPPLSDIQYTGDSTDGNPGSWIVTVADPENGITSVVVKVDGTQVGTAAGTFAVPSTLGTHVIEVTTVNGNSLITTNSSTVTIVEDDPTPPVIQIMHNGGSTDNDPGYWTVITKDFQSDIASIVVKVDGTQVGTVAGRYAVPNTLGTHTIEVIAANGDLDRLGDQQDATASSSQLISDDDTTGPTYNSCTCTWGWITTTYYFDIWDVSGVSGGTVWWSNGGTSSLEHVSQNLWRSSMSGSWLTVSHLSATDDDNDRAGDRTTRSFW